MDDSVAGHLAGACSRSALHPEAFFPLREAFPDCRLIRLSFGLQNKVMLSITVGLEEEGRTHASYVPIHPTAAAAAVLQNNPVVVVRYEKRSPLWDQEDLYQREGCAALSVVSMPFYWPPRQGAQWEGAPLAVPQNAAFHPTFGALTTAGNEPLTQEAMHTLQDLAARTGRHVGPHISMLLSSLEGAGLLPSEGDAQEELGQGEEEEWAGEESTEDLFGFEDAQLRAASGSNDLLPGLAASPLPGSSGSPARQQQHLMAAAAATAAAAANASTAAGSAGDAGAATPPDRLRPGFGDRIAAQQQEEQQWGLEECGGGEEGAAAAAPGPVVVARRQPQRLPTGDPSGPNLYGAGRQPGGPASPAAAAGRAAAAAAREQQRAASGAAVGSAAAAAGRSRRGGSGGGITSTPKTCAPDGAAAGGASAAAAAGAVNPGSTLRAVTTSLGGRASGSSSSCTPSPPPLYPWRSLSFQPAGLERDFAVHYSKRQERADITALALLVLGLLAVAAAHLQAAWPAGVAALLLFTPYFFDVHLYQNVREALLSAALLLLSVFLSSLSHHASPLTATTCAAAAAGAGSGCGGSGGGDDGGALMAGFGICWFVMHTCGLDYLLLAPVLLRLRTSRALPVQGANLVLALHRLPAAYAGVLGRLDTVHVLLLGLLLLTGAAAGLAMCQALERQQREAWLAARRRRGAATTAMAAAN